eukprot:765402-Hanusia_phi.AAC.1
MTYRTGSPLVRQGRRHRRTRSRAFAAIATPGEHAIGVGDPTGQKYPAGHTPPQVRFGEHSRYSSEVAHVSTLETLRGSHMLALASAAPPVQ